MSRRRRRVLLAIALLLVALPVGTVASARLLRGRAARPVTVRGKLVRVRNFFTEMYGARVGDGVVLFDAGVDGEGSALDVLLGGLGAAGGRDAVSDVFLTHGHFDHVAASPLCGKARIHVGSADVEMLAQRARTEPAAARWFQRMLPVGPIAASHPLDGRLVLPLADGSQLVAIPLPGHTPGSYVFVYEGVLIAGDSLQIDGDRLEFAAPAFSIDIAANRSRLASLREQLAGLSIEVVCTGHQACTPEGRGRAMLDDVIARAALATR